MEPPALSHGGGVCPLVQNLQYDKRVQVKLVSKLVRNTFSVTLAFFSTSKLLSRGVYSGIDDPGTKTSNLFTLALIRQEMCVAV